jgi:hypothetical protein
MILRRICLAGWAGILAGAALTAFPPAPSPTTPFVNVLMKNWTSWDRDRDGRLSPEEIDAVVLDPAVSGDAAAAAGTLKLVVRRPTMAGVALTQEYFQTYARSRRSKAKEPDREDAEWSAAQALKIEEETVDRKAATTPNWDLLFSAGRSRIAGGPMGWTGRFVLEHLRQGPLGDCFFLASLASLLNDRPERMKDLIVPLRDGAYRAAFPDGTRLDIRAPTKSELAISSVSAGDGCWLAVMEQAYSQYHILKKGLPEDSEATDIISHGGHTGTVITALTGHAVRTIAVGPSVERRREMADRVLPDLRTELQAALRERRLTTVSVRPPDADAKGRIAKGDDRGTVPVLPAGITRHHAYAILAYDRAGDLITLWNPHGQAFTPRGDPGPVNGYPTVHGRFRLPLTEAYAFCNLFTFETAKPVKTKTPSR